MRRTFRGLTIGCLLGLAAWFGFIRLARIALGLG